MLFSIRVSFLLVRKELFILFTVHASLSHAFVTLCVEFLCWVCGWEKGFDCNNSLSLLSLNFSTYQIDLR